MLRQNCSYKKDIETRKKPKSKEKIQQVCNLTKASKRKLPAENADI